MPHAVRIFVRYVDAVSRWVGRLTMYMIFVMIGVLLFGSITRSVLDLHYLWIVEMAQFTMTAYYILGGAYSMQLDSHVRMDLVYSRWSPRTRAIVDVMTGLCLLFYLVVLLYGGIGSTQYALEYNQRNYSAWAPPMAPIKIIMCIGIVMMLLQVVSTFFKDLAKARGKPMP